MALKESKKLEQANSYELVVTVDGETFEKALNTVYKKEVKKINIPGFRKGKAPRHIIEKMYGKEVFYDDAMQDCYPEALYNAAEEAGVKIVAVESIEVTEVENGFTFKANIVVEPDMEINNYLGFEVTKKSTEVTDELIDEEIEKVRDRNSRMVTVEDRPVANGDIGNLSLYRIFMQAWSFTMSDIEVVETELSDADGNVLATFDALGNVTYGAGAAADETPVAADDNTAATVDADAPVVVAPTTEKGSPDTGVEGIAAVAGVAVVAAGAVVLSKKRK